MFDNFIGTLFELYILFEQKSCSQSFVDFQCIRLCSHLDFLKFQSNFNYKSLKGHKRLDDIRANRNKN